MTGRMEDSRSQKPQSGGYTYKYPRPMVTVDVVILQRHLSDEPHVLLIRRGNAPYAGFWALPGGFVEMDEELEEAAARELAEETGLSGVPLHQIAAFGRVDRDPRGRNICVAFGGVVEGPRPEVKGGDDAAEARWTPLSEAEGLAFDHDVILRKALKKMGLSPAL